MLTRCLQKLNGGCEHSYAMGNVFIQLCVKKWVASTGAACRLFIAGENI